MPTEAALETPTECGVAHSDDWHADLVVLLTHSESRLTPNRADVQQTSRIIPDVQWAVLHEHVSIRPAFVQCIVSRTPRNAGRFELGKASRTIPHVRVLAITSGFPDTSSQFGTCGAEWALGRSLALRSSLTQETCRMQEGSSSNSTAFFKQEAAKAE
jgi:hypothetical protein